jgi:predicted enzyme related to lactoylglutathione lyase
MAQPWHGRFCWYELMTTDPKAAESFYGRVVGWTAQRFPGMEPPYFTWMAGERAVGGLMNMPEEAKAGGAPPNWILYVAVESADATVKKAQSLGAKLEFGPQDIPGVGRFAVLSDPQGAHFSILEPADASGSSGSDDPPAPLEVSWRELATTDREAAASFYAGLFGWQRQNANDMGEPVGVYQEFGRGGLPLGGIYTKPPDMPFPPFWLMYVRVPDLDASLAAVKTGGGQVLMGPMEIPGGDRIAQCVDPQGATFALHQPKG